MDIDELRKRIDEYDLKIIGLLNERTKIVKQIGEKKKEKNKKIYDPGREEEVYRKIRGENKGPLTDELLVNIYREIIASSRRFEQDSELKVCYLGPEGTYSYFAARQRFGSTVTYIPSKGIDAVFKEVNNNRVDYGIAPVENSTEGGIRETLNLFVECENIKVCGEIVFPIHHNLMSRSLAGEVRRIYSKPQVFTQCRDWLGKNFNNAEFVEVGSSTEAAKLASKEADAAAVAHKEVAQLYGLEILFYNIEDNPNNITRFFVLGHDFAPRSGNDKTIVMCYIRNKVGALYTILSPFRDYKINLTNIESLPAKKRAWDHVFYLDFEGYIEDERVKNAIDEVAKACVEIKILGSFPRNEG